jgi:hypothetical protein
LKGDAEDPKALIRDAYRIAGIDAAQCRTIFLAWALDVPVGADVAALARVLCIRYGDAAPDHPMTAVLAEAAKAAGTAKRRGGRAARIM